MAFIDPAEIENLKNKLSRDKSQLGKLYKAKREVYYIKSVDHNLVEGMIEDDWEDFTTPLKTKTKLRKLKKHSTQFEDDIWCQFYELGYRYFNISDDFRLPYGKGENEKKQIDIIAINDESILLIECKSAEKSSNPPSYKTEFEGLSKRLAGFAKTLEQMFGKSRKIKYIFATRNIRLNSTSTDVERLLATNSFFYNDNTFEYVNSLIKAYKNSAHYQFSAMLFKGQSISKNKIEVPAIQGNMGGKIYYMFSIEPHTLLKLGFILHRSSANESEMPTYQRLLVPSRLKGIRKFVNEGGYFPNSVILNFGKKKNKLQFEATSRGDDSISRNGILKIPNAYAIAYIIDGQHRVYGYAGTDYKKTNTIPVVAFEGLESTEQLEMFMNINQNQKAVSVTLRITLEEDLYWSSDLAASRIKALRSSVIQRLSGEQGPLFNKISIGEDKALLAAKPFYSVLTKATLLPKAKGNQYDEILSKYALYNIANLDHSSEMSKARKRLVDYVNLCYEYIETNYYDIFAQEQGFILSNRGTFAFISLIGSLNEFETDLGNISSGSNSEERFAVIEKYLTALLEGIQKLSEDEVKELKDKLGGGADTIWFRRFQYIVNSKFPNYEPIDLIDWKERQDDELQTEGRSIGVEIEKYIKRSILSNLKILYGENWDLELGPIKSDCVERAGKEEERRYKEGFRREKIDWTEQFYITDYKTIIEKHWSKTPDTSESFRTFEALFSIDLGLGFNSKAEKLKWVSVLNSYRNLWAHEGSKEKGLNKEEVQTLKRIHSQLIREID